MPRTLTYRRAAHNLPRLPCSPFLSLRPARRTSFVSHRPVIGIASQTQEAIPGELPRVWIMGQKYVNVLRNCGDAPRLIPLLTGDEDTLRQIYERLDGVFLTGGVDVDPSSYSEPVPALRHHRPRSRLGRSRTHSLGGARRQTGVRRFAAAFR